MGTRNYNCKDEELPAMGSYLTSGLTRDMADFSAFSSRFNADYLSGFKERVNNCTLLVNPREEAAALKTINAGLYVQMGRLGECVNRLSIYFKTVRSEIFLTAADTGIIVLRNRIRRRDLAGTLQSLRLVLGHVRKYNNALKKQGLTDAMIGEINAVYAVLLEENQKQYDIVSNRKRLIQENLHILNDLHSQILEICETGKVLYMGKDAVKVQEYTFRNLVKKVRSVRKPEEK
ncbi:MAG: hypothetical protein LBP50_09570 [Tannerella sp.]|nr:hypothetical protein [Tannerella sp.]